MRTNTQEAVLSAYIGSILFALRPQRHAAPGSPSRTAHSMCAELPESARIKTPPNFADSRTRSVV
jgi:hypothetical protein